MIAVKGIAGRVPTLAGMDTLTCTDPQHLARRVLAALDLTELADAVDGERIDRLCRAACGDTGTVAAVCIPAHWLTRARAALHSLGATNVALATVVNFPDGQDSPDTVVRDTAAAIAAGADEIDLVFPWRALIAGNERIGHDLVAAGKAACGAVRLKVILESGALHSHALIRRASEVALAAGADFLKTSTGRLPAGASPDAAAVMLEVLAEHGGRAGLKVSGGVRSLDQAAVYFDLADRRMGPDWASPERFRIGASRLLDDVRTTLAATRN